MEAHSGLGDLLDDPEHVNVRMRGATPPAVCELKLREKLFHGVQALRLSPIGNSQTSGRAGLLAHPLMLGPNGDSNGCDSIKDYDAFLQAYTATTAKRLIAPLGRAGPCPTSLRPLCHHPSCPASCQVSVVSRSLVRRCPAANHHPASRDQDGNGLGWRHIRVECEIDARPAMEIAGDLRPLSYGSQAIAHAREMEKER
jgi:Tlde1 domain